MKLAFEFYDFDKDGYITEEDVSLVLSYADINTKDGEEEKRDKYGRRRSQSPTNHNFEDRLENQREIAKVTEKMFKGSEKKMNYEEFKEFNTNESSETILCVLKALKQHIPCTDNFYKYLKDYRKDINTKSSSPVENITSSPIAGSKSTTFKATSPSSGDTKNKSFLWNAAMKTKSPDASTKHDSSSFTKEELEENVVKNATKLRNPKECRKERLLRQSTIKDEDIDKNLESKAIRMKNATKLKIDAGAAQKQGVFTDVLQSPSNYLSKDSDMTKI